MDIVNLIRDFVATPPRTEYGKEPPILSPPVTAETIGRVELQLGFRLPQMLARVYTEVANGDIGPGYGIFPVHDEPEMNDLVDLFRDSVAVHIDSASGNWPPTLLPFLSHGCGIYECLDCSVSTCPVFVHDPGHLDDSGFLSSLAPVAASLEERLLAWVSHKDLITAAKTRFGTRSMADWER